MEREWRSPKERVSWKLSLLLLRPEGPVPQQLTTSTTLTRPLSTLCPQHRQLLKDSFMVELVEGARKLRHIFLFTDLLLCTKLKKQSGG